jgi:hypothetical protein
MSSALCAKRALPLVLSILMVLTLVSCAGNQEQAVRHLVLAELIQREDLPENQIQIQAVHFVSGREAVVDAKVLGHGGRFDGWHKLRCTVELDSGRWSIMKVSQE